MPRAARQKHSEAIYHITCRSMSEILLFREEADKNRYLGLLKRYIDKFKCSIYAYCLMDNHLHIQLDPKGFDISKFMQCVNTAYVRYYNKKYNRHGSLFQGRFTSKILDTDSYNLAVSAYIHNNPKDIPAFKDREEKYYYSSYGIYLGIQQDRFGLIDKTFIMGLFDVKHASFTQTYFNFTSRQRNIDKIQAAEFGLTTIVENVYISGRQVMLRELTPSNVISFISSKLMIPDRRSLAVKGKRRFIEYRAICAYALRVYGGLSYKEICRDLHNITMSACSRLCDKGYELQSNNKVYSTLFDELASQAV